MDKLRKFIREEARQVLKEISASGSHWYYDAIDLHNGMGGDLVIRFVQEGSTYDNFDWTSRDKQSFARQFKSITRKPARDVMFRNNSVLVGVDVPLTPITLQRLEQNTIDL